MASSRPLTHSLNSPMSSKAIIGAGQIKATRPVKGSTIKEKSPSPYSGNFDILSSIITNKYYL